MSVAAKDEMDAASHLQASTTFFKCTRTISMLQERNVIQVIHYKPGNPHRYTLNVQKCSNNGAHAHAKIINGGGESPSAVGA